MIKKAFLLLFTAACMLVCIVPSAGRIFSGSNEPIGNERKAEMPAATDEDGNVNKYFVQQLGEYFQKNFAFRPQIISADGEIQSKVFGVSNVDTVIAGKNGWLYYTSTLDDFLRRNTLSQRAVNNIVHNLTLTQEYVTSNGAEFLFTVAPNKNSLYPENMPYYYSKKVGTDKNIDKLHAALSQSNVNYLDLFPLFENSKEVLYLERDSHWNNKGALMVYNALLESLDKQHDSYENVSVKRAKTFYGDLGKMIYPKTAEPEYNYEYDINPTYSYVTPTKSVEDAIIKTQNPEKTGSLYMYRDSFGNALLPFFANAYQDAYFSKTFPVNLALNLSLQKSDTVIFEIVERNINWLAKDPPVFPAPERTLADTTDKKSGEFEINAETAEINSQYIKVSGAIDKSLCGDNTLIYIRVKDNAGNDKTYEAFSTIDDTSDCGFVIYLPASEYAAEEMEFSVITNDNSVYTEYSKDN